MADRRRYEVMLILDPRLEDAALGQAVEKYMAVVTERGGEVTKLDTWGRRKLTFEMNHLHEGYYVVADLQAEPVAMAELDRVLGLADETFRHKITRPGKH